MRPLGGSVAPVSHITDVCVRVCKVIKVVVRLLLMCVCVWVDSNRLPQKLDWAVIKTEIKQIRGWV